MTRSILTTRKCKPAFEAEAVGGPACGGGTGEAQREAHPVGNTGYTSQPLPLRHGEAIPVPFGALHHG